MLYNDVECLPLSGIQHFAFCPRQFALIHIEGLWKENALTFDGRVMHDRANDPFFFESRGTVLITRSVPLISKTLGLQGIADVVEFRKCDEGGIVLEGREGKWQPCPVEYKRGRPKPDDCDIVQVGAQAMCLEDMLGITVSEGALFYGRTRRREVVALGSVLRSRIADLARRMHEAFDSGLTPPPTRSRACGRCSMAEYCLPRVSSRKSTKAYLRAMSGGQVTK